MNREQIDNFLYPRPAKRDHSATIIVIALTAIAIGIIVGVYWSQS